MDIKKIAHFLFMLGGIITSLSIVWWGIIYDQITRETNKRLIDAIGCLYTSDGACSFFNGLAKGKTSYSPALFWVGLIIFLIGAILGYYLAENQKICGNNKTIESKTLGIIFTILGGTAGLWAFIRSTSFAGQIHSWQPPFTSYEVTTIIGAGIAVVLLIVGIINLTRR